MAKVLIAEDELIYREYLAAALDAEGHEVRSCYDGRDAIKVGSFFRPDVLIADWMLKSHIHGLHVARVLRHLNPNQQTILITGFPSADLMLEAESDQVFAFIKKPFDLGELKEKVSQAAQSAEGSVFQSEIGFLEVDAANNILYANSKLKDLFSFLQTEQYPLKLSTLPISLNDFAAGRSSGHWFELALSGGPQKLHCYPLSYADKEGSLFVVLTDEQQFYKKSKLLELLIASHTKATAQQFWPFEGRVLLLDSNPSLRRLAIDLFDSAGALCHSTDGYNSGMKIIERDIGIRYVIIDYEMPDRLSYAGGLARFVEQLRAKLTNITVIGQSERNRSQEFANIGVPFFVRKPWTLEQLIEVITGQ